MGKVAREHNKNHENGKPAGPELVPVHFEFPDPTAYTVCVAGCFNNWHSEAKTLHSMGSGRWQKNTVLAPGTYEYCLVVDGCWIPDPAVNETVENPFGGRNSVLRVIDTSQATHLTEANISP